MCPECLVNQPRNSISDNTPVRRMHTSPDNVNTRRAVPCTNVSPLMDAAGYDHIRDIVGEEINKMWVKLKTTITNIISAEIKPLKEEIAGFKNSINFINEQHEELTKRFELIEKSIECFKSQKTEVDDLKRNINKVDTDNNKREQWSRRSNIEIYGIPEKKGENLLDILTIISNKLVIFLLKLIET